MTQRKRLGLLFILCLLLFGANLGGISIYMLDEAKNSTCAREMLERLDFITPTFNYQLRTDKPPMHYFFMMLAYKWFGVNPFAARFFSAFFGIGTVLATYFYVKKFIDEKTAFWSCIVMLSSIQVIIQFHQAVPDPYLIFFFSMSMFLFYDFYLEKKAFHLYLAYAFIGLGLLTKGPVILVIAGAVMLLFLALQKKLRNEIWTFKPLPGILLVLALALPWYIAVGKATNWEWTNQFVLKHNVERFSKPMEGHSGSIFLIPLYFIWGLFPFSLFIIQAIRFSLKNKHVFVLFSLCIVVVMCCLFSVSGTKLPNYPAPAFPFLAIILGYFVSKGRFNEVNYRLSWSLLFYLLIAIAFPLAIYLAIDELIKLPGLRNLAYLFLVLPAGATAAILLFHRKKFKWSMTVLSFSWMLMTVLFFYLVYPPLDKHNPVAEAMKVIDPNKPVYYYNRYNPAFSFYIKKTIRQINSFTEAPAGQSYILTRKDKLKPNEVTGMYRVIKEDKEMFEPYTSVVLYANPDSIFQTQKQ